MMSPVVVIGDKFSNAVIAVVSPVPPSAMPRATLKVTALEKVCEPVHVGEIDTSIGGAASERIIVVADPSTTVNPTLAVGFANAVPPPAAVIVSVLVFGLNDHTPLALSAKIRQRAVARKFPVSSTFAI